MSHLADKAVRKYLEQHAEVEALAGAALAKSGAIYGALVTIPACGEGASLWSTLASIPPCSVGRVLVVLIVNEHEGAPATVAETNRTTLDRLRESPAASVAANITLAMGERYDLALIDRTGNSALPQRQGVGLARKIAADFAVGLWAHGGSSSNWIHCTDADAVLPRDYFERPRREAVAQLFDYRHEGGSAILEYECFLRYNLLGLSAAGSPWAWHAIGSTLAIDARAYTQVRGFPRREAAEDFHLLAKLSKLGPVTPLRGQPIRLDDRVSERVPFGTGRAMLRARERAARGEAFLVPDPRVYEALGVWQRALQTLGREPAMGVTEAVLAAGRESRVDAGDLLAALDALGALQSTQKTLSKRRDPARSLNENFDALATLRLLHTLRDRGLREVELFDAIRVARFLDEEVRKAVPDLEAVREALVRQERRCLR